MRGTWVPTLWYDRLPGEPKLPTPRTIRFLYLSCFSKPAIDRAVYRIIRKQRVRRIVELGIGTARRAARMIEVAGLQFPPSGVHYTGVDLFEARGPSDGPGTTLKAAHRLLARTGARVQLLPGDPLSALSRAANSLGGSQLVIISAGHRPDALARAWFYLPRMLDRGSCVLIEKPGGRAGEPSIQRVPREQIDRMAEAASLRRAA
jgi:hypothetical protein